MGLRKRLCAVVGVLAVCGAVAFTASQTRVLPGVIPENALIAKPTITLWYTDEVLGDYLASVAFDYQEEYDVRVVPVLTSGLEYLEAVNAASLDGNGGPDLYIVSNDSLEKAHLAGLAEEIEDAGNLVTAENFPQAALDAVTYQGNKVAYPLYFETSALVYNSTYLQQAAEELSVSKQDLIPETIDDILAFADEYNAPETVEAVFKWDVSDIFYNYFFAGNYMNAGGACGDDESQIDIYNLEAVKGLTAYQELNQFFSIDAKNSSYDAVVSDFLAGKLVFTVATTDILQSIEQAKADGTFSCEYDVVPLPDVNEEVKTKGFSVTYGIAVNGYSEKKDMANSFAAYLADRGAAKMYARTGHIPARLGVEYEQTGMEGFLEEYSKSIPIPKLMSMANFWVRMEIAYTKIWSGEDVSEILRNLSEQVMTQVTGEDYTETEYIELPTETETQFLDEGMD